VFDEFVRRDAPLEIRCIEKILIHAVPLAGSWRARGASDGARYVRPRGQQLLAQRRLAAAGRRGNEN